MGDQVAELIRKALMPGGVTVGGIGAFWLLFMESDIPKAIASLVIGTGLSYGARMLKPLHESSQRRSDYLGQMADEVTEKAIAAATGFENKYLLCQAADCESLRSEGMVQHDGIFVPLLEEVFVQLTIDGSSTLPGFNISEGNLTKTIALEKQPVWDFLAQTKRIKAYKQLAILAWGGYGKTTLLKHIAYRYGKGRAPKNAPRLIPILLALRKYRAQLTQDKPPSLPELINQFHIPDLPQAHRLQPLPPHWAQSILQQGKALVMLDGFDEIPKPQRPAVARWINQQIRQYSRSVFIVTSRPKAYRDQDTADRLSLAAPLWVKDFDRQQRQKFVESWYLCQERYSAGGRNTPKVQKDAAQAAQELLAQIEAEPELIALAKNPLLLNMIATFHRRYPGANLPKRRAELYRKICRMQLRDRPNARKLETLLTQCEAQTILQILAFAMMQRRWKRIERTQLLSGLAQTLKRQNEKVSAQAFLEQTVQISELIIRQEDEYEFAHLSFQEYLASAHIAAKPEREKQLYQYLKDDWWKPTILLYAAQINPTRLIREAMRQDANDLAYACLQETTKRVNDSLAAELQAVARQVQDVRYADLEHYLKNRQWKEADKETYRLMITTVGKEEGQWFDLDDLLNFPCEPLKAIDGLWVNYSGGKFGFSVQKQIYVECGAKLDGKYPSDTIWRIWRKFGDTVGWRVNGKWISYSDVTFNTSAPKGHLPYLEELEKMIEKMMVWEFFSSLASRLVKCEPFTRS